MKIPNGNFFFVPPGREQWLDDMRVTLKVPACRRVLCRLLDKSNVMGPSLALPAGTEYNEGLRAVGLWLAEQIESAAPGEFARLMLACAQDRMAANSKSRS